MGLLKAMAVLTDEWGGLQRRLAPSQASRLRELAAQFVDQAAASASINVAEHIMNVLLEELPLADPVLKALMEPQDRFQDLSRPAADLDWLLLADRLRALLETADPLPRNAENDVVNRHPSSAGDARPSERSLGGPPGLPFGDDSDDDANS